MGVKDYCVYWFRKAHDQLAAGGRAGLVGTNSISQNRARGASLQYIVDNDGVITSAVSTQDWPGEAAVDVSIVNWVKDSLLPLPLPRLDGVEVPVISTALRPARGVEGARVLQANGGRAFQGPIPRGKGFILHPAEAWLILETDPRYRDVIRPYLVGDDIANGLRQEPSRLIVDFGVMPLEQAEGYPAAMEIIRERVKPQRDNDPVYRNIWWLLWRPRREMRRALSTLSRFIGGTATGKRILFAWCESWVLPSNAMNVFAFDDDYAMGVLHRARMASGPGCSRRRLRTGWHT